MPIQVDDQAGVGSQNGNASQAPAQDPRHRPGADVPRDVILKIAVCEAQRPQRSRDRPARVVAGDDQAPLRPATDDFKCRRLVVLDQSG